MPRAGLNGRICTFASQRAGKEGRDSKLSQNLEMNVSLSFCYRRNQLSVAMDKFRVRACIIMVAVTFIAAAIVALIGRRERQQGKTVATIYESRRKS